jgi:hypothetical protein
MSFLEGNTDLHYHCQKHFHFPTQHYRYQRLPNRIQNHYQTQIENSRSHLIHSVV